MQKRNNYPFTFFVILFQVEKNLDNKFRDLQVCLSTGPHLPAKTFFTMDFCLCGAILNLKAFCFGAIPDIMIELIAY
jgi:hypothetical protein